LNRYEALKHAIRAHAGAVDKCGQPYILHPIAVAEAVEDAPQLCEFDLETAAVAALLHDVWEETEYRIPFAPSPGHAAAELPEVLDLLTHRRDETYSAYIGRLCDPDDLLGCPLPSLQRVARLVKLADLWHNVQPERLMCLPSAEALSLSRRYWKARDRIWEALGYRWWPDGSKS
jgi:hypothetical protein